MPSVHLHLADGDNVDVCHIVGISPNWVALAVREPGHEEGPMVMQTEFIPYPMVTRVAIHTVRREANQHAGFDVGREPHVLEGAAVAATMTPEEALRAVAGAAGPGPTAVSQGAEQTEYAAGPTGRPASSRRTR